MHIKSIARLTLLIALSSVSLCAKDAFNALRLLHHRSDTLDDVVYRRADEMIAGHLVVRTPQPPPAAPSQSATSTLTGSDPSSIDQAQMDATISAACSTALGDIKSVSNDAGLLGCYNIPFLNTNTGVFEANLRLYQRSEPKGAFVGVKSAEISVQVSYPNAAFSTIPRSTQNARREVGLETRQDPGNMKELQTFLFVGQVSGTLTLTKLQDTDLMALLIPTIQLGADKDGGSKASSNLNSTSMIFFVSGIFQGQSAAGAAAAVSTAAAAAAEKAAAFALPGTTLGIFPVGLIITSTWALLFIAAVGYGTWGRIQFREQFRQRKGRAVAAGKA